MKVKEYGLTIILNAFLGYLWILFVDHSIQFVNSTNYGILLFTIGTVLFFDIVHRVAPFNQYKLPHPIKITGIASFIIVIAVHFLGFNLV